jgi:anthranilate synthase component 1
MTKTKIYPHLEKRPYEKEASEIFADLTHNGQVPHTAILDSGVACDYVLATLRSALKFTAMKDSFSVEALTPLGESLLGILDTDLYFAEDIKCEGRLLTGRIKALPAHISEEERLRAPTSMEVLKYFLAQLDVVEESSYPTSTLIGCFSFEFLATLENVQSFIDYPKLEKDFTFYFPEHFFVLDNHDKSFYHGVHVLADKDLDVLKKEAKALVEEFEPGQPNEQPLTEDRTLSVSCEKEEFCEYVDKAMEHVIKGDVFQIQISRTKSIALNENPYDIYRQLKINNPSPFQFYVNFDDGCLFGCSPELAVQVSKKDEKGERRVNIHPIAGTAPIGSTGDDRFTAALQTDIKELSEHMMLVDLARNDIAKLSKPGTRKVASLMELHKYSHVQHMVSRVEGILMDDLDCFHAVAASGNMGTLTGAPKCRATELLQKMEGRPRGFYGGAVGFFTHTGEVETAIVIRSVRVKNGVATTQAAAGIVLDSIRENEFEETNHKMGACVKVLTGEGK